MCIYYIAGYLISFIKKYGWISWTVIFWLTWNIEKVYPMGSQVVWRSIPEPWEVQSQTPHFWRGKLWDFTQVEAQGFPNSFKKKLLSCKSVTQETWPRQVEGKTWHWLATLNFGSRSIFSKNAVKQTYLYRYLVIQNKRWFASFSHWLRRSSMWFTKQSSIYESNISHLDHKFYPEYKAMFNFHEWLVVSVAVAIRIPVHGCFQK